MKAFFISAFMPVVEQLATQALISNKAPFKGKNKLGLGLLALSGFFIFVGLIFATISGYNALLVGFNRPLAALITSGVMLLLSIVMAVVGCLLLKRKKRAVPANDIDVAEIANILGGALGEDLKQPIQDNPKTAVALASLAGLLVGDRLN